MEVAVKSLLLLLLILSGAAPADPVLPIGRLDTIGGTTYDWQNGGPAVRMLCNAPDHGIHALWMYSASDQSAFPDRNNRHNFYDYATNTWNWIDPDHMQSGVSVFSVRSGYGNLACDPVSQVALVGAHSGSPIGFMVGRDIAPGAGIFEYCDGPDGWLWPVIDAGQNRWIHAAVIDDATRDQLWYSRCTTWCQWSPPVRVAAGSDPMFPSHNITASKVSRKVCLTWVVVESGRYPAYYSVSTDGGNTWPPPTQLPWPPAFSGDTLPAFHLGVFPFYDRQDQLHIAAEVMPFVGGNAYIIPTEIWHWSPENTPQWAEVHRAGCAPEHLKAPVGYNAIYAGRPSLCEDLNGGLYVAWEQFDSSNVEPGPPEYLRADIWYAQDNCDNGASWQAGIRITDPDQTSKRFPCAIDLLARDTLCVIYMQDLVAGFFVQSEGPATDNPIIVQFVPVTVSGVKSDPEPRPGGPAFTIAPNPANGQVRLQFNQPLPGPAEVRVFDSSGRQVFFTRLLDHLTTGPLPLALPRGAYLVRLTTSSGTASAKLVVQ